MSFSPEETKALIIDMARSRAAAFHKDCENCGTTMWGIIQHGYNHAPARRLCVECQPIFKPKGAA